MVAPELPTQGMDHSEEHVLLGGPRPLVFTSLSLLRYLGRLSSTLSSGRTVVNRYGPSHTPTKEGLRTLDLTREPTESYRKEVENRVMTGSPRKDL